MVERLVHSMLVTEVATLGGLGETGVGSELAIVAGAILWRIARLWLGPRLWSVVAVIALLSAMPITGAVEEGHGKDPGNVVLDELVGAAPVALAPGGPIGFLAGIVLYGQLDHFKPLGIVYVERLPGGVGIVLDDLGAAVWALVLLTMLFRTIAALWGRTRGGRSGPPAAATV